MKKFLLVLATMITLTAKSQTSVYHPFPDSNATWNIHYWGEFQCGSHPPCDRLNDFSYVISGDTVINSETYHKLYTPNVQLSSYGWTVCGCSNYWRGVGYNGSYRQDTSLKKVWYMQPGSSTEQLLYDFNAGVGDTVGFPTTTLPFCNYHPLIVSSIDSVLIGTDYRKRWHLSFFNEVVIEGIGSSRGILETNCIYANVVLLLTCFKQEGVTLYPYSSTSCGTVGINELTVKHLPDLIFPNPFHSNATLELKNYFENTELKIYNAFGEQVRQQKIISSSTSINRSGLADGIYFYQVINDRGIVTSGMLMIE